MRRRIGTALAVISVSLMQHAPAHAQVDKPAATADDRQVFVDRGSRHPSMNGIRPSAYKGRYYTEAAERFRLCVIKRESGGRYWAANPTSSARAAYQWLSGWQESIPWMLKDELQEIHGKRLGAQVVRAMQRTPRERWPRWYQDAAFFTVVNYDGPFSGARHWYLAGSPCNQLAGMR